jgi:hypothetical protein
MHVKHNANVDIFATLGIFANDRNMAYIRYMRAYSAYVVVFRIYSHIGYIRYLRLYLLYATRMRLDSPYAATCGHIHFIHYLGLH